MTIVLTPKELLEAAKHYAMDQLDVPREVADAMKLEWYDMSSGKYEDANAPANHSTVKVTATVEAVNFSIGPYR